MIRHKVLPVTLLLGSTLLILGIASGSGPDDPATSAPDGAAPHSDLRIEAFGMTVGDRRPDHGEAETGAARIDDAGPDCRECPDGRYPEASDDRADRDSRDSVFVRVGMTLVRAAGRVCICVLDRLLKFAADRFPIEAILKGLV